MVKSVLGSLVFTLFVYSGQAVSQAASGIAQISPALEQRLTAKISAAVPQMPVESVKLGPFAGIYAVQLKGGPVVYTDAMGDLFVAGDLYRIEGEKLVNLEEIQQQQLRKPRLAALDQKDMIVFPAVGEKRAAIYVFTDVDCGYCRKLHREVPALNRAGVEVRYLAYPRAGIHSDSYQKLVHAWCADDSREALTRLKNGIDIPSENCRDNPVARQYQLGMEIGVKGTPAIFLESGEAVSGYRPSDALLEILGLKS